MQNNNKKQSNLTNLTLTMSQSSKPIFSRSSSIDVFSKPDGYSITTPNLRLS